MNLAKAEETYSIELASSIPTIITNSATSNTTTALDQKEQEYRLKAFSFSPRKQEFRLQPPIITTTSQNRYPMPKPRMNRIKGMKCQHFQNRCMPTSQSS